MGETTLTTTSRLKTIWNEVKAATRLVFPGYTNSSMGVFGGMFNLGSLGIRYPGTEIDYQAKVGDASLSSLVMASCNWISRRLPEARLQVIRTDSEDNEQVVVNHPLVKLLQRPTGSFNYYSGKRLWAHFALSRLLDGNVYWWKIRNEFGQVVQIWPLISWLVTPRWEKETSFIDYYEYVPNGQVIRILPEDIVHFRFGPDDPDNNRKAMAEIRSLLREVCADNERANFYAALMTNFGVPPLLVSFKEVVGGLDGKKGEEKLRALQSDIQRKISGDQRGQAMLLTYPLDVRQLAFNPKDLDMREAGYMSEDRFCATIGIDGIELGLGSAALKATYNNKQTAIEQNTRNWLVPTWEIIAEEITVQLLLAEPQFLAEDNETCRHDYSSVAALRDDQTKLQERTRKDVLAGFLKVRDAQMMNGWKDDPEADYYLRSKNLIMVKSDGTIIEPVSQPNSDDATNQEPMPSGQKGLVFSYLPLEHVGSLTFPGKADLRDYSSTHVLIEGDPARLMRQFSDAIPDGDLHQKGRESNSHITILYGLHEQDVVEIAPLVRGYGAVKVTYGRTEYFAGDEYDVVYVSIKSPSARGLHQLLANRPHTSTHARYTPHATLAYVKPGLGRKYAGEPVLVGTPDVFHSLVFSNKEKKVTTLDLLVTAITGDEA